MFKNRRIFFWLLLFVLTLLARAATFISIGSRDIGGFAYAGHAVSDGAVLYRDVWDHKTPLIYYLNALVFKLFPAQISTLAVFEIFWLLFLCAAFRKTAGLVLRDGAADTITLLFAAYAAVPENAGAFGLTETYAMLPSVLALYAVFKSPGGYRRYFLSGTAVSAAFLFRQTAATVLAPVAVYAALEAVAGRNDIKALLKNCAALAAGVLLPVLIFAAYFYSNNALKDCVSQVFAYNSAYAEQKISHALLFGGALVYLLIKWKTWGLLLALAFGGCLAKLAEFRRGQTAAARPDIIFMTAVAWAASDIFAASYSGRFYSHYFIQVIPSLAFLGGYAVEYAAERINKPAAARLLAAALIVAAFLPGAAKSLGAFKEHTADTARYAGINGAKYYFDRPKLLNWLVANTSENDSIYIWGAEAQYYLLAKRASPSRYFYIYPLETPDYTTESMVSEFWNDIKNRKPKAIVDTSPSNPYITPLAPDAIKENPQGYDTRLLLPVIRYINDNYNYVGVMDGWKIYALKETAGLKTQLLNSRT